MRLKVNVKNPRENRCFQTVIVFSFGSVDNLNKCTVLWKMAAKLIAVSTSVNNEMWVKLRTLGEHVEQNVSLATSPDAHLRRPVRVTALRRADVCAIEPGPHGSTPPRNQCTPGAPWGQRGLSRHAANPGPDFRSSSSFGEKRTDTNNPFQFGGCHLFHSWWLSPFSLQGVKRDPDRTTG